MIDPSELERLSKAATQGVWEFRKIGHDHLQVYNAIEHEVLSTPRSTNAAFIVALVNAYRTGQLVPVQQPSGDVVEAVARAIYKADTHDQNRSTRPQLDLSGVDLDQWYDENAAMPLSGPGFVQRHHALATAAITAYEALRAKDTRP